MKIYSLILLVLLCPALNAMERQSSSNHALPLTIDKEGLDNSTDIFDETFGSSGPSSPNNPSDGADFSFIRPEITRMKSSVLNQNAEKEYHESHPDLFYKKEGQEILDAKIKNFGKILRCGTNIDIGRVGGLLSQMPEILVKVQRNFVKIQRNLEKTSREYTKLDAYKEIVEDIAEKINSSKPYSVSELLAVLSNVNASIIEAESILSKLIKKRLEALSQEVQSNSKQSFTDSFFSKSQHTLSDHIKRIGNAVKFQDEFLELHQHILSFSNLLQDFFFEERTQEGKRACSADQLLAALTARG